jgi:hypothetical protein
VYPVPEVVVAPEHLGFAMTVLPSRLDLSLKGTVATCDDPFPKADEAAPACIIQLAHCPLLLLGPERLPR